MTDWEGFEDDIAKLQYLACNGSKSAALFLKEHYSDGPAMDKSLMLKYASYAALAGDYGSFKQIVDGLRCVEGFYPEDVVLSGPFEAAEGRKYHGYASFQFTLPRLLSIPESSQFNVYNIRDEDLVSGRYPYRYSDVFDSIDHWPLGHDMDEWVKSPMDPDDAERNGLRFHADIYRYFGIGVERDEDAAIRDLLEMAIDGSLAAADMISYAIGYESDTFSVKVPDRTAEQERLRSESKRQGPRKMFYPIANRSMLESCPEWQILCMLMHIDGYGFCSDPVHENADGCYEDGLMLTRLDNQYESRPPTFEFKPSGYSMGWYKYAWRSPEQSENLSMGEIRRVMRLCIEHLAYGREIPNGTTKELISLPRHLYVPPDDIADAIYGITRTAPSNVFAIDDPSYVQTIDFRHADAAEAMAVEIIRGLAGESL